MKNSKNGKILTNIVGKFYHELFNSLRRESIRFSVRATRTNSDNLQISEIKINPRNLFWGLAVQSDIWATVVQDRNTLNATQQRSNFISIKRNEINFTYRSYVLGLATFAIILANAL